MSLKIAALLLVALLCAVAQAGEELRVRVANGPPKPRKYRNTRRYRRRRRRNRKSNYRVSLWDLGVFQLVAHDAFKVHRPNDVDMEGTHNKASGWADLETVLRNVDEEGKPYFDCEIARQGGDVRNRFENPFLRKVASNIGNYYCDMKEAGYSGRRAYNKAMRLYRRWIRKSYYALFQRNIAKKWNGDCDWHATDDLAWRSGHVMLPGKVPYKGNMTETMTLAKADDYWTDERLHNTWSKPINGHFDPEFHAIPTGGDEPLDLWEKDHTYGIQFQTEESFQHYLDELDYWGWYKPGLDVTNRLRDFFARAYHCPMRRGNYDAPNYN